MAQENLCMGLATKGNGTAKVSKSGCTWFTDHLAVSTSGNPETSTYRYTEILL